MSDSPRRLLLLINSLEGGGAESVMAYLANAMAKSLDQVEIRLALLDDVPMAHDIDAAVDIVQLDCCGSMVHSVLQTRRLIADWKPHAVLSFLTRANCAAVLARKAHRFRCVISERVNTSSHLGGGLKGALYRLIVTRLYPKADAVIAVSQGVRGDLTEKFRVPAAKILVIYNPVDIDRVQAVGAKAPVIALPDDYFVNVGRLVPNKGGKTLLRAFAQHQNRNRALVILGEGPERSELEPLAQELGIADRVYMPGYVSEPHAIMRRASGYVAASRAEGFPNALVEAMALGCAVATTDCPSGPAEILADRETGLTCGLEAGPWGVLVPMDDAAGLAAAMDFLDDPANRQDYAQRAACRAKAFSPAPVVAAYRQALGV